MPGQGVPNQSFSLSLGKIRRRPVDNQEGLVSKVPRLGSGWVALEERKSIRTKTWCQEFKELYNSKHLRREFDTTVLVVSHLEDDGKEEMGRKIGILVDYIADPKHLVTYAMEYEVDGVLSEKDNVIRRAREKLFDTKFGKFFDVLECAIKEKMDHEQARGR